MKITSDGNITPKFFTVQQYNKNVNIKKFEIDRYYKGANDDSDSDTSNLYGENGIDLSTCKVYVLLDSPDDKISLGNRLFMTNASGETIGDSDTKIIVNWIVNDTDTQNDGTRQYQIVFEKEDKTIAFRTELSKMKIQKSLDSEENLVQKDPNAFQEFSDRLDTILENSNSFEDYADEQLDEKIAEKTGYYKNYVQTYTTEEANENNIAITLPQYDENAILGVYVNGIKNYDYTVDVNNEIVFTNAIAKANTTIKIEVLKSILANTIDLTTFKQGANGTNGQGVPTGGTANQILAKKTSTNYDTKWMSIVDLLHPVGSYYETSDSEFNPNTFWGGTWEYDGSGTVLVSKSNTNGSLFDDVVGTTVGEEKHTLTLGETPTHNLDTTIETSGGAVDGYFQTGGYTYGSTRNIGGSSTPFSVVQPSKIVNRWHRIA